MAEDTQKLLTLVNAIENGVKAIAERAPDVSNDVAAVRAVIANLRETLELPTLERQDAAIGGVLDELMRTTASPDDRASLEQIRAELKARGIKAEPPPS